MTMSTKSFQHHIHERPNLASTTNGMRVDYGDGLKQPPTIATQADAPSLSASSSSSSPSPDPVPSGVPNPFLNNSTQVSAHHNNSNVQCINWGNGATTHNSNIIIHPTPHQVISSQVSVPNPFQPINTHTNGSVTPPPGTAIGTHEASPSTPTSAQEMPMPVPQSMISNNIETMNPGFSSGSTPEGKSAGLNSRRQKRLERNRESARLSRRRRKQYLEVLEERVKSLSVEMDKGRREHVAVSVPALREKKSQELSTDSSSLIDIETFSTSRESRVAATFLTQQMNSLSLAPHIKFLLWLSMQNDSFFRGGRASSERLSAARIGERMLSSGNDRVPPAHGMWPLFCNEVGLSYDQEEKVRAFQKSLLLSSDGWLQRHSANSSGLLMQSTHDTVQALAQTIGKRQTMLIGNLTAGQKRKFLQWSETKSDKISNTLQATPCENNIDGKDGYEISDDHHEAANMYILNHRIQKISCSLVQPEILVNKATLRRFARRPSFESLGSCMATERKEDEGLSRESSFASSGSLKRSASELSVDDEEKSQVHCIPPEEAELIAKPAIEGALGFVKPLIPAALTPTLPTSVNALSAFTMPPPPPKSTQQFAPQTSVIHHGVNTIQPSSGNSMQVIYPSHTSVSVPPRYLANHGITQQANTQAHIHQHYLAPPAYSSQPTYSNQPNPHAYQGMQTFLSPHLNAVPEEGYINGGNGTEDFLLELAEEDWAIGEGYDDMNLLS